MYSHKAKRDLQRTPPSVAFKDGTKSFESRNSLDRFKEIRVKHIFVLQVHMTSLEEKRLNFSFLIFIFRLYVDVFYPSKLSSEEVNLKAGKTTNP